MTDLTSKILANCYSRVEALSALHELSRRGSKEIFVEGKTDSEFEGIKNLTAKNFESEIKKSEEEIKNIPVVTLYAPIMLNDSQAADIGQFLRDQYGEGFLVDFRVEPELVAWCKLVWNGQMKDFSWRAKMEQKKEEIRKIVLV